MRDIILCSKCHMLLGFGGADSFIGPMLVTGGWAGYRWHTAGHKIVDHEFEIPREGIMLIKLKEVK